MKKLIIINSLVSGMLISTALIMNHLVFTKKVVFVNLNQMYTKFELTSTLEKKAEQVSSLRNNILDSLKFSVESQFRILQTRKAANKLQESDVSEFDALRKDYLTKKESFEKSETQMLKDYEKQIWNQLNTYVLQFGKEKKYDLVLGANGNGNIMYSDEAIDVTSEALAYVNQKFKGN